MKLAKFTKNKQFKVIEKATLKAMKEAEEANERAIAAAEAASKSAQDEFNMFIGSAKAKLETLRTEAEKA